MGLWSCLVSLQMGQDCRTWDCGPVWFLCRWGRTVEHGTVVLSGLSTEGQNCRTWDCGSVWFLCRGGRTVEHALGTVALSGIGGFQLMPAIVGTSCCLLLQALWGTGVVVWVCACVGGWEGQYILD